MLTRFSDPFDTLFELQEALDAAMSSDWFGMSTTSGGAFPPINAFQKGDDFVVVAEIAGVRKSDLNVQIKKNQLRLAGKKTISYGADASVHRRERIAGEFDRTITLPFEIDTEAAKAEYRDGILALFMPRSEQDKPRAIEVV